MSCRAEGAVLGRAACVLLTATLTGCAVVTTGGEDGARYRWHLGGLRGAAQTPDASPVLYNRYSAWGVVLDPSMLAIGRVDYATVQVVDPARCHAVIVVETDHQAARLVELLASVKSICVVEKERRKNEN